jgi:hypothetical protein
MRSWEVIGVTTAHVGSIMNLKHMVAGGCAATCKPFTITQKAVFFSLAIRLDIDIGPVYGAAMQAL